MNRSSLRLGTALALFSTTVVRADVETAFYFDAQTFMFEFSLMPDLDQRRAAAIGVPGLSLDGSQHCVPTATTNLMIYIATHGYPFMAPGPGNYQSGLYNHATQSISELGDEMYTNIGGNGTSPLASFEGTKAWLTNSAPGLFTVSNYTAKDQYCPRLIDATKPALGGAIVNVSYGRYEVIGQYQGHDVLSRDGGHCTTFGRSLRVGALQLLGMRDPADPDDDKLFSQSAFGNREVLLTDRIVATGYSANLVSLRAAINYDPSKEKNGYLDRVLTIQPVWGLIWLPGVIPETTEIETFAVAAFAGGPSLASSLVIQGTVIDAITAPDQTSILAVVLPKVNMPIELHEIDLIDGTNSLRAIVPNARTLHVSRNRQIYVAAPNLVTMFDFADWMVETTVIPPFPIDALAYDDKSDELIALSSDAKRIMRWKEGLATAPTIIDLPSSLVMGGASTLCVDPTDGEVLFATEKSPVLVGVKLDAAGNPVVKTWDLAGVPFPSAIDVNDIGHLFAVANDRVQQFAWDEANGWHAIANGPFESLAVAADFRVTRSRTNHDPATMSGPAWRDLDPSEIDELTGGAFVPDCVNEPSNLEYGLGKPGSFGVPHLEAIDLPTLGLESSIRLSNGRPGALPVLFLGTQQAALPFDGGTLHVVPQFVFTLPVPIAGDGTLTIPGTLPGDPSLCGFTLYHQMIFVDPSATGFYHTAQSNGLARTFGS